MFKHKKLDVWQDARKLVKRIYGMTALFPKNEKYGLCDQLQRAAVSVPSNIAEGSSRETPADFVHFLVIARGSLSEVDTQLTLAEDLQYISADESLHSEIEAISKRITALIRYVRTSKPPNL